MNTIANTFAVTTAAPIAAYLSGAGLLVVLGTWIAYFARVPSGKVPIRPIGSIVLQCLGMGLAVTGLLQGPISGAVGVGVAAMAGLTLLMGALFLWLLTQRKTPVGDLKVAVGDQILAFSAQSADGSTFQSGELLGKRTLLKFFRGGW